MSNLGFSNCHLSARGEPTSGFNCQSILLGELKCQNNIRFLHGTAISRDMSTLYFAYRAWISHAPTTGVCYSADMYATNPFIDRGVGRWFGKGGLYRSIGKGSMISVYKIESSYVTIRKHRGAPAPGAPSSFLHFHVSPFPISSFPVPLFITTR